MVVRASSPSLGRWSFEVCTLRTAPPHLRFRLRSFHPKSHSPHFSFVVWLSAPPCATLSAPSLAHLTASFKCSTVKGELLAVTADCAVTRGAAAGTREVLFVRLSLTLTVLALQTHAAPHPHHGDPESQP